MRAGLVAEFAEPEELLAAIGALRRLGYRELDALSPYDVPGVTEALDLGRSPINWMAFALALVGAGGALLVQWFTAAKDYPINVGGRPDDAVPAFVPIVFEMGVLGAALAAFLGLFVLLGLPRLDRPLFDVAGIERASIDRFFVAVDARDPCWDEARTADELRALGPLAVSPFGRSER